MYPSVINRDLGLAEIHLLVCLVPNLVSYPPSQRLGGMAF